MSDTATAAEQAVPPTLNVTDIQNAVSVIDHAADQGAFRTWDTITKVLDVRNKLAAFVAATAPPSEEAAPDDASGRVIEAQSEPAPPSAAPASNKSGGIKNPSPKKKAVR